MGSVHVSGVFWDDMIPVRTFVFETPHFEKLLQVEN